MKRKTRKVSIPTITRQASFDAKTVNREERTVEVVWTTGARGLRRGFFTDDFFEELGLETGQVRMERLESGRAPVLDNHGMTDKRGVSAQIGVVRTAQLIPGQEGRAVLKFSRRNEVEEIFQDIEDDILVNVSVGYDVHRFEKVGEEDGIPVLRATDWEPIEISMVPAGFDQAASVRSEDNQKTHECEVVEDVTEEPNPDDQPGTRAKQNENNGDASDPENQLAQAEKLRQTQTTKGEQAMDPKELEKQKKEAAEQARAAEKGRQTEIRSIVSKMNLGDELASQYIEEDKSVDEVRALVIDARAEADKESNKSTSSANPDASVGEDIGRRSMIEGMSNALLHRFRSKAVESRENGQKIVLPGYELSDVGREYAYGSLIDLGRRLLEANGVKNVLSLPGHRVADMILGTRAGGMHSTSDFKEILANVQNKTLRGGYDAAPQTFQPFTTMAFVSDFKEISRTNLSGAPELKKVGEGGEIEHGTMAEAAEKYRVEEYARTITLTRKTIVNDDLLAFTRVPERMGRKAADLESDVVWDVIKLNAALSDGFALYSAQHANLSTAPGAPSEAGFTEMREALRRQKGLVDTDILALIPVWIFVPPGQETAAEKQLTATRPNAPSEVNPFGPNGRTSLQMDVEPRLELGTGGSTTAWYGFADKGQVDMVELAMLEGTDGPQIQSREGFDVAGIQYKIMHDVAAKAIDHRGMWKNAGA